MCKWCVNSSYATFDLSPNIYQPIGGTVGRKYWLLFILKSALGGERGSRGYYRHASCCNGYFVADKLFLLYTPYWHLYSIYLYTYPLLSTWFFHACYCVVFITILRINTKFFTPKVYKSSVKNYSSKALGLINENISDLPQYITAYQLTLLWIENDSNTKYILVLNGRLWLWLAITIITMYVLVVQNKRRTLLPLQNRKKCANICVRTEIKFHSVRMLTDICEIQYSLRYVRMRVHIPSYILLVQRASFEEAKKRIQAVGIRNVLRTTQKRKVVC